MSASPRFARRLWLAAPLFAFAFLLWSNLVRIERVNYVNAIAEWSVDAPAIDPASPTGYAHAQRRHLVPEHNNKSYQWIAQTQRMLATGEARIWHTDADNAPFGRATHLPSLYRWWLGFTAWLDHVLTGRSFALAAEHAALFADPLLHALLLIAAVIFIARHFGRFPAAVASLAIVGAFPFAGGFLAGAPDQHGLAAACALGSVLPLLAGLRLIYGGGEANRGRCCFYWAGVAGGVGMWISAPTAVPILGGVAGGALFATWLTRSADSGTTAPWRSWALAGCVTSLAGYMLEFFPDHLALQLEVNHPLYALAWLGVGELLQRATAWIRGEKPTARPGTIAAAVLAVAALAAVPVAIFRGEGRGFLLQDPVATRLSYLNGIVAKSLAEWIARDGFTPLVMATLLPLLLIVAAGVLLLRAQRCAADRASLALALGPVAIALIFACFQLRWFNVLDATLLALLVAVTSAVSNSPAPLFRLVGWSAALAGGFLPGLIALSPPAGNAARHALAESDVDAIIERDLAHWLAQHSGGERPLVLASPDLTTTLAFHGGARGLGTLDWDNKEGFAAAVRIASATSPAEALALIQQRGVSHIVIPSWDPFLEEYARLGSSMADRSFVAALKRWAPFFWLRPVAYHLPEIGGIEAQSVIVLEVVEEQEEPVALSAMAEYFVEMGLWDRADAMGKRLLRFPGNLGARIAIAHLEFARGNAAAFAEGFKSIVAAIGAGGDRALTWEQRVSLAGVLAQAKRADLARDQVRRCLAEASAAKLRALSSGSLFRLLVLAGKLHLEFPDARLHEFAVALLPPASRSRL